jgi:hypothetical protein
MMTDSSGNGADDTEHQSGLSDDDGPARSRMPYGKAEHDIAVTGSTGEDYAEALGNALVLETDDPDELVGAIEKLVRHPAEHDRIRAAGQRTAAAYVWDQAIEHLTAKVGYLIRKQGIALG